jgi:hypothetical protein
MTDLSFIVHVDEQERLEVSRKSYLFRKAPRKRISLHTLLLGLIGGLAIAPSASPQITPAPSAKSSTSSINFSHGPAPHAAIRKLDKSTFVP